MGGVSDGRAATAASGTPAPRLTTSSANNSSQGAPVVGRGVLRLKAHAFGDFSPGRGHAGLHLGRTNAIENLLLACG